MVSVPEPVSGNNDVQPRIDVTDFRRILITGASGFLGQGLLREALAAGLQIRTLSRRKQPCVNHVESFQGDILDNRSLTLALSGVDGVVHAAGLAHIFNRRDAERAPFDSVNAVGTQNVVNAAVRAGVSHFVLISSVSVYGGDREGVVLETDNCSPETSYAKSKLTAETKALELSANSSMRLTVLRMATLYGPGDPGNVGRLVRAIDSGRFIWIGRGENLKSLIFCDDAARASIIALRSPMSESAIFNVSAPPCTMREIVDTIHVELGRSLPRWHVPAGIAKGITRVGNAICLGWGPLGAQHNTIRKWLSNDAVSVDKIRNAIGFESQVGLAEGLRRQIANFKVSSGHSPAEKS